MILINRKSTEILALTGSGNKVEAVTMKKTTLYFNKVFCVAWKLKPGQYVHFFNDGKMWRFYINDDPDGFKLISDKRKNGSLLIFNAALTHLIRKSTGKLGTVQFPIEAIKAEIAGKKLFMLLTDKAQLN